MHQSADVAWGAGDLPISRRHGDLYFQTDGLAEARHVFLGGNGLPGRFAPGFHIAELGFGTGLNALAALAAWRASGQTGPLRYTAFEAWPMARADRRRALGAFPEIAPLAAEIETALGDGLAARRPDLDLRIIPGDARDTLPVWEGTADAWFLDGFAPARNPDIWEPALLAWVGRRTAPGGTVATFTAAGAVRRALAAAGFQVARSPGFGRKRHMTTGARP